MNPHRFNTAIQQLGEWCCRRIYEGIPMHAKYHLLWKTRTFVMHALDVLAPSSFYGDRTGGGLSIFTHPLRQASNLIFSYFSTSQMVAQLQRLIVNVCNPSWNVMTCDLLELIRWTDKLPIKSR